MDFGKIFVFGLTGWLKDAKSIFFGLLLVIVAIVYSLVSQLLFLKPLIESFSQALGQGMLSPEALVATVLPTIIGALGILFLSMLVVGIINFYIELLIITAALEQEQLETQSVTAGTFIRVIIMAILASLIAFTSWYSKKLRLFFAALVILTLASIFVPLLLILVIFLWLAYLFVIIRNDLRLSVIVPAFLSKGLGIRESLRHSWEVTNHKAIYILIAWIIFAILAGIIGYIGQALTEFSMTAMLPEYAQFMALANQPSPDPTAVFALIPKLASMLTNPLATVAALPQIITTAIVALVSNFFMVAIYSELLREKGGGL